MVFNHVESQEGTFWRQNFFTNILHFLNKNLTSIIYNIIMGKCTFKVVSLLLSISIIITSIPLNSFGTSCLIPPSCSEIGLMEDELEGINISINDSKVIDSGKLRPQRNKLNSIFRISASRDSTGNSLRRMVKNISSDDSDDEDDSRLDTIYFIGNFILFITGTYSWLAHKFFPGYDGFWKASFVGFLLASLGYGLLKQIWKFIDDYIKNESEDHGIDPVDLAALVVISIILLPIILYFNWGIICVNVLFGIKFFITLSFPIEFGWILLVNLFSKLIGRETKREGGEEDVGSLMITTLFCAPIIEEVLFRYILFNLVIWVWMGWFNLDALILGIPFGVLLSMVANADEFWSAHGKDRGASQWIGGIVYGYVYWKTHSLIAPMTMHFLWNLIIIILFFYEKSNTINSDSINITKILKLGNKTRPKGFDNFVRWNRMIMGST